ncbi:MAG: hypothetical protein Q9165_003898 [Trypethelium subeluteriae]
MWKTGTADMNDVQKAYIAVTRRPVRRSQKSIRVKAAASSRLDGGASTFRHILPVRWIISMDDFDCPQSLESPNYTLYVVGHHIAVDSFSMSLLSKDLLQSLRRQVGGGGMAAMLETHVSPALYGEYIHQQIQGTTPFEWITPKTAKVDPDKPYRVIDIWRSWSNDELKKWSQPYKTSWFRVATSIIGLITASIATPTPYHDHALMLAFGGHPPAFASCISHMADAMPVKSSLSSLPRCFEKATIADVVKALGKNLSQPKRHEIFSFMTLIEEASKVMDDSLLRLEVAVTFSPMLADSRCSLHPMERVGDLFFCFLEREDGVSLGVVANPQVFDQKAVSRLKAMFIDTVALSQTKLESVLSSLGFLHNRGLVHIVSGLRIDDVEATSAGHVHEWIRTRAALQPYAIALSSTERKARMAYAGVVGKSAQNAYFLVQSGTAPGDKIVQHVDRSFDIVLWILGTFEAGACYVVIDKAWLANPQVAVTDTDAIQNPSGTMVLNLWGDEDKIASMPKHPLRIKMPDDALAYSEYTGDQPIRSSELALVTLVFTSGSIGQPKGVMVEHSNPSHSVSAARGVVKIGPHT